MARRVCDGHDDFSGSTLVIRKADIHTNCHVLRKDSTWAGAKVSRWQPAARNLSKVVIVWNLLLSSSTRSTLSKIKLP